MKRYYTGFCLLVAVCGVVLLATVPAPAQFVFDPAGPSGGRLTPPLGLAYGQTLRASVFNPNTPGRRNRSTTAQGAGRGATEAAALTKAGRHDVSVWADGIKRWFILYVPERYDHTNPTPLVFAFHGGAGGMNHLFETRADLIALAEAKNFLLVFPNGQDGHDNLGSSTWNAGYCCGPALLTGRSDVEFVRVMVQTLRSRLAVDRRHIHALGLSNGGMFTHKLAAEMPDTFASVATMAAAIGGRHWPATENLVPVAQAPIPIMIMHGMADTQVNFNGGFSSRIPRRYDMSFNETVSFWVQVNSCHATPATETRQGGKGDINVSRYRGCANGAEVVALAIQNVEHGWMDRAFAGFDGTRQAIAFFEQHPKR